MTEPKTLRDKLANLISDKDNCGFVIVSELYEKRGLWKNYGILQVSLRPDRNTYVIEFGGSDNYKVLVSPHEICSNRDKQNDVFYNPSISLIRLLKDVKNRTIHLDDKEGLIEPQNVDMFVGIFLDEVDKQPYVDPETYGGKDNDWKNDLKKKVIKNSNPGQPSKFC